MGSKRGKLKFEELDCTKIGCIEEQSESELEQGEGWWLHYEKRENKKLWQFAIQIRENNVYHQQWVQGAKAKPTVSRFASAEQARRSFMQKITEKKNDGYHFVCAKM
jgi:hypothetical protein